MPTLRSWELRYGIPSSQRPKGRHRRYSPAELHSLRLMRDEISRGRRAAVAARVVRDLLDPPEAQATLIRRFLVAAEQLDGLGVQVVLSDAAEVLGLANCVDQVLLPALRQVGTWWAAGRCDAGPERVTTAAARGWLQGYPAATIVDSTYAEPAGLILLGCGPNDAHTVGLEALALLLRSRGWQCRLLGARVNAEVLAGAVAQHRPAAVVLVSQLASGRRHTIDCLSAVQGPELELFYAGNAFTGDERQPPGTFLGTDIGKASRLLINTVTGPRTRTAGRRQAAQPRTQARTG